MASSAMPDLASVPPTKLEDYMIRLFKIGDKNGDGILDALELRDLLRKSGFNLDNQTIARIMVAVDTNRDGVIQFHEFARAIKILISEIPRSEMPEVHNVSTEELQSYLQRLFNIGDKNGDGVLSPAEFESLLRKSGFNFDNMMIRKIMNAVDVNGDGVIQYEEFVPAIMALLRSRTRAAEHATMPSFQSVPPQQLELYLQRLFKIGDKDGNGVLDALEFRDLLRKSGFQLDDETITKIMVAADTNKDGVIQFEEFLPAMRALVKGIPRSGSTEMPSLENVAATELRSYLQRLFKIGDKNGDGVLQPAEFESLLNKSGFSFSSEIVREIMSVADTNGDGLIQYEEFVPAIMSLLKSRPSAQSTVMEAAAAPPQAKAAPAVAAPAAPAPEMPDITEVPPAQLERYMQRLFKIGDKDENGVLDALELRDLLRKSGFQLDDDAITKIMVAVDTNRDGVIQYDEFCNAINMLIAELHSNEMPAFETVSTTELTSYLQRLFKIGDVNGDGVLQPEEFEGLLRKSGFQFGNEMISKIMDAADVNQDGVIQYNEFVPAILALVRNTNTAPAAPSAKAIASEVAAMPSLSQVPPAQLERYMQRLFKIGDKDNNGSLDALEVRDLLRKSGFNLDNQTIARIMVGSDTNKDGVIQYSEFCRAVRSLHSDGYPVGQLPDVCNVSPSELRTYLQRLFNIGDKNGDGVLSPAEFESLLRKSGFNFDNMTIRKVMDAVDVNSDGVIQYEEFVPAILAIIGKKSFHDDYPVPAATAEPMPDFRSVPSQQLELYLQRLFKVGDRDGNGVLDALEFRDLLRKSGFNFDNETINRILVAADTNRDGVIQYSEFVPAMRSLVQTVNPVQAPPPPEPVPFVAPPFEAHPGFVGHPGYVGYPGFTHEHQFDPRYVHAHELHNDYYRTANAALASRESNKDGKTESSSGAVRDFDPRNMHAYHPGAHFTQFGHLGTHGVGPMEYGFRYGGPPGPHQRGSRSWMH
jgi:Ca2+-binding EF-hand superfamily protein